MANDRDPQANPAAFLGAELRRARLAAGITSQDKLAQMLGRGYSRNRSCAGQRLAARVGLGGLDPGLTCGFCSVFRRSTPVK
jgi:hypothetical protein